MTADCEPQRAAARLRAKAGKQAIEANKRAVKGLQVEFNSGQRSLLDVLDGGGAVVAVRAATSGGSPGSSRSGTTTSPSRSTRAW